MRKGKFTLSDDGEEFEGWVVGSEYYRRWAMVCMTKEQVVSFLATTPYDYTFYGDQQDLVIYWDDRQEIYPTTTLPTEDGDILVGYFLDLEWVEVEN